MNSPSSTVSMASMACLMLFFGFVLRKSAVNSSTGKIKTKISGGSPAPDKAFPFQVYIEVPHPENTNSVSGCGGALIKHPGNPGELSRYKILTAAHCFDRIMDNNKPTDKDLLVFVLLAVNNIATEGARGVAYRIKFGFLKLHPNYDGTTNQNDLALIPLPSDFNAVPGLYDAIPLPPSTDNGKDYTGTEVNVAGWGESNPEGHSSDQLLFYRSKVLTGDLCEKAIAGGPVGFPFIYNANVLCTDGTGEKGVCSGDSGSPLTTAGGTGTPSTTLLVGISSFGLTENCEGSLPSYFVRVVKFVLWIESTI